MIFTINSENIRFNWNFGYVSFDEIFIVYFG